MKQVVVKLALLALAAPVWAMEPVPAAAPPRAASSASPAAPAAETPRRNDAAALEPAVQTSTAAAPAIIQRTAQDRLELEATQITGNRELPRVLYVVPWKRSDLGDLSGKPANSLLDEVLAPVDRDVFRRQNRYYQALKPDAGSAGKASSTEVEK
jgi:hypothetical protein